ncbi:MAG: DUF3090 domain-containing protein [Candidatus Rokuibacteriota bacterium]|nr:MAG: DUF3090 domain-containing protein [Candidatus Rokubacteria bacterium]
MRSAIRAPRLAGDPMSPSFDFDDPEVFTAGTVGPPGQRVFYLQARQGAVLATLKAEKEQVRALAEYLGRLLAERPAAPDEDDLALVEPFTPAWVVGSIGVGYDEAADRVMIEVEELVEEEENEGAASRETGAARVRLSRSQAAAFVKRAAALIEAGRAPCPICGRPINPAGHVCPRSNGHARD